MKPRQTIRALVSLCAILLIGLAECSKQGVTPRANADAPPNTTLPPAKSTWVSQTTSKQYQVAIEGDVIHVEWINLPAEWVAHGAFMRTECKRQGTKWVGTTSSYMPWTAHPGPNQKVDNWCHLETSFEFDSITATDIKGIGENVKKFDSKACQILESGNADFHWTRLK